MKFFNIGCLAPELNGGVYPMPKSCSWKPIKDSTCGPRQRNQHCVCICGRYLYMYGGRGAIGTQNDLWRYDLDEKMWCLVSPSGDLPPPLEGHTIVEYESELYMFGGEMSFGSDGEVPLWIYNQKFRTWTKKYGYTSKRSVGINAALLPKGRREHVAVVYQNQMCIQGGYMDLKGPTNEMWMYHFKQNKWEPKEQFIGHCPLPRYKHSAVVYGDILWMCGGLMGITDRNETQVWSWDFLSCMWNQIRTRGAPQNLFNHASCIVSDEVFVFGGDQENGKPCSRLWKTQIDEFGTTQNWQLCHFHDKVVPSPSSNHCFVVLPSDSPIIPLRNIPQNTEKILKSETKTEQKNSYFSKAKSPVSISHSVDRCTPTAISHKVIDVQPAYHDCNGSVGPGFSTSSQVDKNLDLESTSDNISYQDKCDLSHSDSVGIDSVAGEPDDLLCCQHSNLKGKGNGENNDDVFIVTKGQLPLLTTSPDADICRNGFENGFTSVSLLTVSPFTDHKDPQHVTNIDEDHFKADQDKQALLPNHAYNFKSESTEKLKTNSGEFPGSGYINYASKASKKQKSKGSEKDFIAKVHEDHIPSYKDKDELLPNGNNNIQCNGLREYHIVDGSKNDKPLSAYVNNGFTNLFFQTPKVHESEIVKRFSYNLSTPDKTWHPAMERGNNMIQTTSFMELPSQNRNKNDNGTIKPTEAVEIKAVKYTKTDADDRVTLPESFFQNAKMLNKLEKDVMVSKQDISSNKGFQKNPRDARLLLLGGKLANVSLHTKQPISMWKCTISYGS